MTELALLPVGLGEVTSQVPAVMYADDEADSVDGVDDASARAEATFFVPVYMGPSANLALMAQMPRLKVCQMLTAGFDNALAHLPEGVILCNAAGVHDASTAELTIGLIIANLRGLDDAARDMSKGIWRQRRLPALADKLVLVIGAGGVAQAIRRRLEPFEVEIILMGRNARDGVQAIAELETILPTADVVILAVPLDDATTGMVDARFLSNMKDGALLVNVARGKIVQTDALLAELTRGRLRASLDVTDPEPLPWDHPLWSAPGLLISPHGGGNSSAFLPRARRLVSEQLARLAAGQDLVNRVG
jgi:phosphoglycerate dehydrogenase-like enzyme